MRLASWPCGASDFLGVRLSVGVWFVGWGGCYVELIRVTMREVMTARIAVE